MAGKGYLSSTQYKRISRSSGRFGAQPKIAFKGCHIWKTLPMEYYIYMILCADGSYYTGYTKDLEKRFAQHKKGSGSRHTRLHKPVELVYAEKCHSRSDALRRERRIKMLTREKKQKLAGRLS
jgi:putative endonuclease